MNLRRVLIVADESADWIVAGLRQLDRLALSIDEFAVENNETAPVLVCVFWRADLDESQRWTPDNPRLTHVAFVTSLEGEPYDLILSTRLFLYRRAVRSMLESTASPGAPANEYAWDFYSRFTESLPRSAEVTWEYISDGGQIDAIESRFLCGSGKSQDGFVSRFLNRPISRTITRLLLRFPVTPTGWTCLIVPIPIVASLILVQGTYASFVWGLVLFQIFSILDGCDGEIARATFMESESGRQLDDLFDVLSNIVLVLGLGFGLRQAHYPSGGFYLIEGIIAAVLIAGNEWYLSMGKTASTGGAKGDSLGGAIYPRHRELVERSGLLAFGARFASLLIQLTKRDVAVLFFVFLAIIGLPSLILHLLFLVTAASLALALKAHLL